jgi:hypothetical protein
VVKINICPWQCLHFIHTVSEWTCHKCIVPLTSVSIFWCFPCVEFSLRLLKPCAGGNKFIYFTKVWLSDLTLLVHVVQQCFDMIYFQKLSSSPLFQLCLFRVFHPLGKFLRLYKNFHPVHFSILTVLPLTSLITHSPLINISHRAFMLHYCCHFFNHSTSGM